MSAYLLHIVCTHVTTRILYSSWNVVNKSENRGEPKTEACTVMKVNGNEVKISVNTGYNMIRHTMKPDKT